MRELPERMRAQLRRATQTPVEPTQVRVAGLVLDKSTHLARASGRSVPVTPTELALLEALMARPGHVFDRDELLNELSGAASTGRTVDVHIRNLRAKIEPDPAKPRYIETVFGAGYRFCAEEDEA
jgi:DNA-binding response OmpR family regulator